MKSRSGEKIKLLTVDQLLGVPEGEHIEEIEINKIHGFKNHPFKVHDNEKMKELVESILGNGILTPVIVRPDDNGGYEMISGHRRLFAANTIGIEKIPAFVKEMKDDEATIVMVDSNIQRDEILPSEKGFAYKMRYEAMKRQGVRRGLSLSQSGTKLKKEKSGSKTETNYRADEELAKQVGESRNQIHRFMRLTELIPELLELVDKNRIAFMTAVDVSFLDEKVQKWLYQYISDNGVVKSYQIIALRHYLETADGLTQTQMIKILNENLPGRLPSQKVILNTKKLHKYFPAFYTSDEIENIITKLLENWKHEKGGD